MAYVPRFDNVLKRRPENFQTASSAGGAPRGVATGAGSPAPAPSAGGVAGNPQASSAGGFVSFEQRLGANQSGAEGMANRVATDVQAGAKKAQAGLKDAVTGFDKKVKQSTLTAPNPATGAAPTQKGGTLAAAQGQVAVPSGAPAAPSNPVAGFARSGLTKPTRDIRMNTGTAPTNTTPAPSGGSTIQAGGFTPFAGGRPTSSFTPTGDVSELRQLEDVGKGGAGLNDGAAELRDYVYDGPNDLESQPGWSDLQMNARDADEALGLTADNAGLEQLVNRAYPGQRTAGGSALDAALTGAAGGQRFAELRGQYPGLSKAFADANTAAKARADEAKKSSAAAAGEYARIDDANDARPPAPVSTIDPIAMNDRSDAVAADLNRDQSADALANRRGVQDSPRTVSDERAAAFDGVWEEWIAAGSPPYEDWKRARNAKVGATGSDQGLKGTPNKPPKGQVS